MAGLWGAVGTGKRKATWQGWKDLCWVVLEWLRAAEGKGRRAFQV